MLTADPLLGRRPHVLYTSPKFISLALFVFFIGFVPKVHLNPFIQRYPRQLVVPSFEQWTLRRLNLFQR
jgi:hypothetical protein